MSCSKQCIPKNKKEEEFDTKPLYIKHNSFSCIRGNLVLRHSNPHFPPKSSGGTQRPALPRHQSKKKN